MKKIKLLSMHIQNFKGYKDKTIDFGEKTRISGANATGKTTIFDAFTWLLFEKDSLGSSNFDIRPLDANGKMIDNIEISVEAKINVGSDEYELKKTQRQKWVKKRGTGTTELQGNINEFSINGYPKSQKDFKDFIAGIIDEDIFTLITNPTAFNSLPWKKQRETLMKFVGTFSDAEIAETFGGRYAKLIPELKIASTDDILKKYTKSKSVLNKDMVEIPARIDEISKQLVIADVGALEGEKAAKEVALQKVEDEISGGNSKLEGINAKREEIMNQKLHLSEIQNAENQKLMENSKVAREKTAATEKALADINHRIAMLSDEINATHDRYEAQKVRTERLTAEWRVEKAKTYPAMTPFKEFVPPKPLTEDDFKCSFCGHELSEEEIKEKKSKYEETLSKMKSEYDAEKAKYEADYADRKKKFDDSRDERMKTIVADGTKSAALRDELKAKEEELRNQMAEHSVSLVKAQEEHKNAEEELKAFPTVADVSENAEYKATIEKISALEKEIEVMSAETSGKTELEAKKAVLKNEIAEIAGKIMAADNTKVKERIAELEAEQKSVGQKIADQEQMIDLVEDFIRAKMNMISEKINGMFKIVSFKLFSEQINGGLKETCECTVNGVPLSSLNNGHRIVAGLDIIQSLSNLYEVSCPIFVDNAESINNFNVPDMDAQMIYLMVTDDKELKVES